MNQGTYDANKKSLDDPQPYYKHLGSLFQLNKKTILKYQDHFKDQYPNVCFDTKEGLIPTGINRGYHTLSVAPHIKIFGVHELDIDDSGLTVLQRIIDLSPVMETAHLKLPIAVRIFRFAT